MLIHGSTVTPSAAPHESLTGPARIPRRKGHGHLPGRHQRRSAGPGRRGSAGAPPPPGPCPGGGIMIAPVPFEEFTVRIPDPDGPPGAELVVRATVDQRTKTITFELPGHPS